MFEFTAETKNCPDCGSDQIRNLLNDLIGFCGGVTKSFWDDPIIKCKQCNFQTETLGSLFNTVIFYNNLQKTLEENKDNKDWDLNSHLVDIVMDESITKIKKPAIQNLSSIKKLLTLRLIGPVEYQPLISSRIEHLKQSNPVMEEIQSMLGKKIPLLEKLEYDTFGYLATERAIIGLNLSDTDLIIFPERITQFYRLQTLFLHHTKISSIPNSIENLKQLRFLALNGNEIEELPDEITKLTQIEELLLHDNQIGKLPEDIGNLQNLKSLTIHANPLKSLPSSITQLNNLERLVMEQNEAILEPKIKSWIEDLLANGCEIELISSN